MIELMVFGVCVALPVPLAFMALRKFNAKAREIDVEIMQDYIDMDRRARNDAPGVKYLYREDINGYRRGYYIKRISNIIAYNRKIQKLDNVEIIVK